MKIVAIGEIHYEQGGVLKIANPGTPFDVPKEMALRLLDGDTPAARRMTEQEIELDKLRAQIAATAEPAPAEPAPAEPAVEAKPAKAGKKGADAEGY